CGCKSRQGFQLIAVISGETMTGSANPAAGPFVRRERTQGSSPSTATSSPCAALARVGLAARAEGLDDPLGEGCESLHCDWLHHRSKEGTQGCEACWLRFESSRWYEAQACT